MSRYETDEITDVLRRAMAEVEPDSELGRALGSIEPLVSIVETATDLIATATIDGKVLYLNRAAKELLHWHEARTIHDAHPSCSAKKIFEEGIPSALAKGSWRGEALFLTPDGREVPHSQTILRHDDPEGRPAYLSMIARDISEHVELLEKLRLSEERHRRIFEDAPVGIFHTSISGTSGMMNPAMASMLGYDSPEQARRDLKDVATQVYADPGDRRRMLELVSETEGFVKFRTRFRRRNGEVWPVRMQVRLVRNTDGSPDHLEGFCEDITERVRAEDALRRSEAHYRAMIEDQTELIVRWRPDGTRVFANEAYYRYFGLEPEECIGGKFWPLVHPEDRDEVAGKVASLTPENPVMLDVHRAFAPDGSIVWQEWTDRAIFDAEGRLVEYQSVGRDITRRHAAQEALRESERRLELALEGAGLGLWDLDLPSGNVRVDARLARLAGLADAETVAHYRHLVERIEPARFQAADEAFERHLRGETSMFDAEVRHGSGEGARWLRARGRITERDQGGRPVRVTGIALDVTDAKRAEEELAAYRRGLERLVAERTAALEESQQHLKSVVEALPIALFAIDPERRLSFYLGRDIEIGFDPSGMTGSTVERVLEGRPDVLALLDRSFAGETATKIFTLENGRFFEVISMPRQGGGVLGLAIDVTGRRRMELSLREAERHLQETQRLEAIGRLAGGVAHDFNNMMTIVTVYSKRLMRRAWDPETRQGLDAIYSAGYRAARLTRQLLAFASRQILQPREISLNEVVAGMEPMLRGLLGPSIAMHIDLSDGALRVRADPAQMEQVIVNLVANARDAMPAGGQLEISTRNRTVAEDECAGVESPGRYVALGVRDTGEGIPPENMGRIFEPFFTTRELGKGIGLGLPAAYGIVRQSGGCILVESLPGRGSTFTVLLPVVPQPEAEEREGPSAPRVVVVEDDDQVRRALVEELAERGYAVLEAADGETALELCRREPRPDVLLADVALPGISGRELHEKLESECNISEVLYISGHAEEMVEPGTGFLQKPFDTDELDRRLRELISRRRREEPAPV